MFELQLEFFLTEEQKKEYDMPDFIQYVTSETPYVSKELFEDLKQMATEYIDVLDRPFKVLSVQYLAE
jgi:bacterioferritin (cytochrome b1)